MRLCGRVLQDEGLPPARDVETRWRNLVAFYKRLESDEAPGARLRARLGARTVEASSDREGHFSVEHDGLSLRPGWHDVDIELVRGPVKAKGRVLVPSPRARFGVVSDIDDTDTETAAAHAAAEGLIGVADLQAIRSDKRSDERTLSKAAASSGVLK